MFSIPLWSLEFWFAGLFINCKFSFTTNDWSVQIVLIQSWWGKFLKICAFLLGCLICWHITIHSIFFFLVSLVLFLLFHLFYLGPLFSMNLAKDLSILSSKNKCLVHWCFLLFSGLFIFPLFHMLSLGLVLFVIPLDVRLGCSFEIFLFSWGRPYICYELPIITMKFASLVWGMRRDFLF